MFYCFIIHPIYDICEIDWFFNNYNMIGNDEIDYDDLIDYLKNNDNIKIIEIWNIEEM